MAKPIPPDRAERIVAALRNWPAGASFVDVAASLHPIAPMRNVQRWLMERVHTKQVVRAGKTRSPRYKLPDAVQPEPPSFGSTEGRALHELVTQPVREACAS